jgi:BirA family biotin operon repressor/biotin-[acetyl-CoA-carboxylase] ligase
MKQLAVHNPFNAPVYHVETTGSTMNISHTLADQGSPHGTVIVADFQEAGRGRIGTRLWDMERCAGLPFTVLLRYPQTENIPAALTLRTGLAVAEAIEDFAPVLKKKVMIKWPNDIMVLPVSGSSDGHARKVVGILAEADGGNVHVGIGVNVSQREFPQSLKEKAMSIGIASGREITYTERYVLLEKILAYLYTEIETANNMANGETWGKRIEEKLYKKGKQVSFAIGAADSHDIVTGIVSGIGRGGELLVLIAEDSESGEKLLSFASGEILFKHG